MQGTGTIRRQDGTRVGRCRYFLEESRRVKGITAPDSDPYDMPVGAMQGDVEPIDCNLGLGERYTLETENGDTRDFIWLAGRVRFIV